MTCLHKKESMAYIQLKGQQSQLNKSLFGTITISFFKLQDHKLQEVGRP